MNRRLAVGIAVAVFLLVGAALVFSVPTAESPGRAETVTLAQTDDVDRTVFRITVFSDGDARWTVENRREIPRSAEDEIAEFESFADRFLQEETETFENFRTRADKLTQEGSDVTGREMNATDFQRDARYSRLTQEGIVEMSFRWEGFAQKDGDRVVVSDVFDGGFVILEDQKLRFESGENLRFESVPSEYPPDRTDGEGEPGGGIEWDGPQEFSTGQPELVFVPADTVVDGGPQTDDADDGSTGDGEDGGNPDMMIPILLAVLVFASAGGGALWYLVSRSQPAGTTATETAGVSTEPAVEDDTPPQEEQFLSDEDRILKLLDDNGGRMRQVSIVEETDWSKSKVSMLLSDMEEDGEISKLRVGRENIISIAGEEPAAAGSPFEDDESE